MSPAPQLANMKRNSAINTKYVPVGWLDQDRGRWTVRTDGQTDDGELYVRFNGSGANTTTRIGALSDGEVSLDVKSGPAIRIGRPVWLGQPISTKAGARW